MDHQAGVLRPKLAVLSVLLHEGRVLLVRRRNPPDQGLWGYPGGHVEWGETLFAAAERELFEETAIRAKAMRELTTLEVIVRDHADQMGRVLHHFILIAVLCRYQAGRVMAGDDALEAGWILPDQVLSGALPLSADVDLVLQKALSARPAAPVSHML